VGTGTGGTVGAWTAGAGVGDTRGAVKPGGGDRGAGVPDPGAGVPEDAGWEGAHRGAGASGMVPTRGVPAGGKGTNGGSSSVRKSSSCVGGEGRLREKGNVVSSKTTWREMMTRFVARSRHL